MKVGEIRHAIWVQQGGRCWDCDVFVTESQGHLHELIPRGRGGKISLDNSRLLCAECHLRGPQNHGNRRPQFGGETC